MNSYICLNEYGATCEGFRLSLSLIHAEKKENAAKRFNDKNNFDDYFRLGTQVFEIAESTDLLKDFFSTAMIKTILDECAVEMDFYFYINGS